jgi:hypothetical protein
VFYEILHWAVLWIESSGTQSDVVNVMVVIHSNLVFALRVRFVNRSLLGGEEGDNPVYKGGIRLM